MNKIKEQPVTMEWLREQTELVSAMIVKGMERLGELIVLARKNLLTDAFEEYQAYLLERWTHADLRAAQAIYEKKLPGELFPVGVKSSKVLSLSDADRGRLLSGERFQVYGFDGTVHDKTWEQMNADEKNRLLGSKGGRIFTLAEQSKPTPRTPRTKVRYAKYTHVDYSNGLMGLRDGDAFRGEIPASTIQAELSREELAAYVTDLLPDEDRAEFVSSILTDELLADIVTLRS